MAALSNFSVISERPLLPLSSGSSPNGLGSSKLALSINSKSKSRSLNKALVVQAKKRDGGSAFVSGLVLGGLVVGALGFVYAPQISKALSGTDKKDLMEKLPNFIKEKALEKQRKKLAEKIEQLNSAIDNVSTQLRTEDDAPTEEALGVDNIEALV